MSEQERDTPVKPHKKDDLTATMADPYLVREAWLGIVKPVAMQGRLDSVKAQQAKTPKQVNTARVQNHYLTRRSYGMPEGYEKIAWKSQTKTAH